MFDAIIALAYTFQYSSSTATNSTVPEYLAIRENDIMRSMVSFDGISGYVSFNSIGDRNDPKMTIFNYHGNGKWINVGDVNSSSVLLTAPTIVLPNGVYNSSTIDTIRHIYGKQSNPVCPAGSEPNKSPDGLLICSLCDVGKYKATSGDAACLKCPTGGDCNDIGWNCNKQWQQVCIVNINFMKQEQQCHALWVVIGRILYLLYFILKCVFNLICKEGDFIGIWSVRLCHASVLRMRSYRRLHWWLRYKSEVCWFAWSGIASVWTVQRWLFLEFRSVL